MRALGTILAAAIAIAGCSERTSTDTDDAARVDAGGAIDVGATDGGRDASMIVDAGHDAAIVVDAGTDAATVPIDAGTDAALAIDANVDAGPTCTSSSECATSGTTMQFCEFPAGACGGTGTCTPYGGACPLFYSPVCGCDGHTYTNQVCAHQAGVSVRSDGACATCGCATDGDCATTDECVSTSSGGVCHARPTSPACWSDLDCTDGRSCVGAAVCPCGASCFVADHTGTCGLAP